MSTSFTIFQVSWLTNLAGNESRFEQIIEHVYHIIKFLQDNGLVRGCLIKDRRDISGDFALYSSDLTEDGLAVMKAAYDKWLTKVDNGMSPEDVTLLEKALKKIRSV